MRLLSTLGVAVGALITACSGSTEVEPKDDTTSANGSTTTGAGGAPATSSVTTGMGGGVSTSVSSSSAGGSTGDGGGGGVVDPWAGPLEHLKELDVGALSLGVGHNVPIPDRTLGFTVLANAPSVDEVIGISRLKHITSTPVIEGYAMAGHDSQVFGNEGWVAGADPQSDSAAAMPVKEGYWRLWIGDDDGSIPSGHVSVWVRRTEDGQFHGGAMDVNVFIAPGASDAGYMNQVLGDMFPYAGVSLGDVTYYVLDASHLTIETRDEYRTVLATSAGAPTAPALNIFVVADFGDGDFGGAIGVAGGIPGSAVEHGTTMSGVAYQPSGNAGYDATVLMHEVGHLGGLFHTTEFQITETDPLSDTAECPPATIDSNPDACPDKSNVMFPIAYGATTFSGAQLKVLQGSALYRGSIVAGGPPGPPVPMAPPPGAPGMRFPSSPLSRLELLDPAAKVATPVGPAPSAPARAAISPALERVLKGVWCGAGGDYLDLTIAAAGAADAQATLRTLALDEGLADLVRARAFRAYVRAAGRASSLGPALDLAELIAAAPGGRQIRIAAVRALTAHDGARAARVVRGIQRDEPDVVLRDVAGRVVSAAALHAPVTR